MDSLARASPLPRGWLAAVLVMLALAAYAPTLRHGFVWDDHEQVVDNPSLRDAASLPHFWTRDVVSIARQGEQRSNYYRPLFFTLYFAHYQLFGASAPAWHAMAILWHVAACFAAWALARRLGLGEPAAFLTAVLFALAPVHGESVAWVAAAFNDPPAAVFMLLALCAHARAVETASLRAAAASALLFGAALGFKESAISFLALAPAVELWLTGWPRRSDPRQRFQRGLRLYAPPALVLLLYLWARQRALGTLLSIDPAHLGLADVLPTLPHLALFYLRLLVWPFGLAPSYPLRYLDGWSDPRAWGSLLALAVLVLGIGWLARRRRELGFAAFWIGACVLPALHTRSFRPTYLVHQRYLYLAVFGLCLLLAVWLTERVRPRVLAATLIASLCALWSASLLYHHRFWASDEALWRRIAEVDPANPASFDWLGARALASGRIDEARDLFERSIAADPDSPLAPANLALLEHLHRRRPDLALPYYERALALFEGRAALYARERANCRLNHALALAALGRPAEAIDRLLAVAAEPPYPVNAARNAAVLLRAAGRLEEARTVLEAARVRHPNDAALTAMLRELPGAPPP